MKGSANKQNIHSCGNKWQKLHQGNLQREIVMLKKAFYFTQYKQNKLKIVFVPQNMKNSSLSSVRVF